MKAQIIACKSPSRRGVIHERKSPSASGGIAEDETPFAIAITQDGETGEWDEVRYEQFLRESDALTERYGRLLEKYKDHPDSERIIAREMGWRWLEEALDRQEQEKESEDLKDECR